MGEALNNNTLTTQEKLENKIVLIRKILICFFVSILIASVVSSFFTHASAVIVKTGSGKDAYYTISSTDYKVADLNNKVFGGLVLAIAYDAYGGLASLGNSSLLQIDTEADYFGALQTAYDALAAVGVGLALLWCLLDLIEKSSSGHITGEFILQLGIKLTIACVVISSGGAIAKGLIEFGNGIITDITTAYGAAGAGASATDQLFIDAYNEVKSANFLTCIGKMLEFLIPGIFMKIVTILLFALLAGRVIEVAVRYIFFPIGAADVFTHGAGSSGFRYMKRLAGAVMQGAGMYVVIYVGMALMAQPDSLLGTSHNVILDAIYPIIIGISMVGAMLKVSSIINDVTG